MLLFLFGVLFLTVFLILASRRPDDFCYVRSILVEAPAARIFPHVDDFQLWGDWSPWEALDPEMKRSYSGPRSGVGAVYSWSGNSKVGAGSSTIIHSEAPEEIRMELKFLKPFAATHEGAFYFEPQPGGATKVTWEMIGKNNLVSKAMGMIINLDNICGRMFEKGLSRLKEVVEKPATVGAPCVRD